MKPSSLSTRLLAMLAGALLAGSGPVFADFLLPNHAHTQTLVNNTGKTANDLHVNLVHAATGSAPSAPPFTVNSGTGATSIDFSGGTVAAGGKSIVSWESKFASDKLHPTDPGHWTFDGTNIGNVTVPTARVSLGFTDQGGGLVTVSVINNTSSAVNYSNLQIWRNADSAFFTPANYLSGQFTGNAVGLLVANAGTFAVGSTDIATFSPSLSPLTYNSGSALIDGELLGNGSSAVPEPGPISLAFLGLPVFYLAIRRRLANRG